MSSFYEDNRVYLKKAPINSFESHENSTVLSGYFDDSASYLNNLLKSRSLLVLKDGKMVRESYFNQGKAEESRNIHSASKGILSALFGIAVDKGIFKNLNQPICELLPHKKFNNQKIKKVTILQLLTMSSGIKWREDDTEFEIEEKNDWVQAILDLPIKGYFKNSASYNYNTGLTHLLSAIISHNLDQDLLEFAKENLLDPLNISVEHWGSDPEKNYSGGYNFYMTPRDLAIFSQIYLNDGKHNSRRILSEKWIKQSLQPWIKREKNYYYGFYWYIWQGFPKEEIIYKLWGFGGQFVYLLPKKGLTLVITNDTEDESDTFEMDGDAFLTRYLDPIYEYL